MLRIASRVRCHVPRACVRLSALARKRCLLNAHLLSSGRAHSSKSPHVLTAESGRHAVLFEVTSATANETLREVASLQPQPTTVALMCDVERAQHFLQEGSSSKPGVLEEGASVLDFRKVVTEAVETSVESAYSGAVPAHWLDAAEKVSQFVALRKKDPWTDTLTAQSLDVKPWLRFAEEVEKNL